MVFQQLRDCLVDCLFCELCAGAFVEVAGHVGLAGGGGHVGVDRSAREVVYRWEVFNTLEWNSNGRKGVKEVVVGHS